MPSRCLPCVLLAWSVIACAAEPDPAAPAAQAEPAAAEQAQADPAAQAEPTADATPAAEPAAGQGDKDESAPAPALIVTDREAELARIVPRLAPGDELQWLEADGHKFFAFQRKPRQGPPKGAILVVPAPQEFIDERDMTRTLRSLPPAGGFVTLAVQPPLSPAPAIAAADDGAKDEAAKDEAEDDEAKDAAEDTPATDADPAVIAEATAPPVHPEFCPRLAAAMQALTAAVAGVEAPLIAIAAADASVPAVLGCYAGGLPPNVRAFAAIGDWQGDFGALALPTIEFVPTRDPAAVLAADRRSALPLAEDSPPRRRVDLDGVNRRCDGAGVDIAKRLRGWLERLPPPPEEGQRAADSAAPTVSS